MILRLTVDPPNSVSIGVNCDVEKEKFYFSVTSTIEDKHTTMNYRSFKKACRAYKKYDAEIKKGSK